MIKRFNLNGSPNHGVAISATDEVAIIPTNVSDATVDLIKESLEVSVIKTPISGSNLVGALAVGNSNGFLVSQYAFDSEIERIRKSGVKVERIPDKFTAVGNIILANDHGAIINPLISDEALDTISSVFDVEVKKESIAKSYITGSVATATNKGILTHPSTTKNELKFIENIMKAPADIGTVNNGIMLVGACTVANSNGVIVGENTTGPELARIEEAFGFLEGYL